MSDVVSRAASSSGAGPGRSRPRRVLRVVLRAGAALLALALLTVAGAGLWFRIVLGRSLPRLDGEIALAGLSEPVRVERDARGVPTIRGATRLDVARATG